MAETIRRLFGRQKQKAGIVKMERKIMSFTEENLKFLAKLAKKHGISMAAANRLAINDAKNSKAAFKNTLREKKKEIEENFLRQFGVAYDSHEACESKDGSVLWRHHFATVCEIDLINSLLREFF